MKKVVWIKRMAAGAAGMWLLAAMPPVVSWAGALPEGLYAGEQSLGGMTEEEAKEAVESYVE